VFTIGLSIQDDDDLLTRATLLRETMSHPSQIITDAVAAIDREDWAAFIDLCDPVSVRRFKNELVWQFSDHGYSRGVEVEDFLEEMPEIPREVAEHYVEEMNSKRDPAYRLSIELSTVSSLAELDGLEPAEVLVRWLQSRMIRREDDFSVRKWGPSQGLEVTEIRHLVQEEVDGDFITSHSTSFSSPFVTGASLRTLSAVTPVGPTRPMKKTPVIIRRRRTKRRSAMRSKTGA